LLLIVVMCARFDRVCTTQSTNGHPPATRKFR
jgi:hypothetical protein